MAELHHECGIVALYHLDGPDLSPLVPGTERAHTTRLIPRMLLDLQNRGQLAAGMTSFQPGRQQIIDTYKEVGMVSEVFRMSHEGKAAAILQEQAGHAAIGHVRYATSGPNSRRYAQPFEREHGNKWKWFAFAFNGQLANFLDIKREILDHSEYHLTRDNDTEVIMHCIARELKGDTRPDLVDVFRRLAKSFDGAYNIVYLDAGGRMAIVRDPKGFRPLCIAQDGNLFAAASESVALDNIGMKEVRSLEPGEMVLIEDNQISFHRIAERETKSHCFFEWIYFANIASTLDERSVYLSRASLGKRMARRELELGMIPMDEDTIVVPVPDTGKAAADAMAHELKLASVEGLIRNRYVGRTFIQGGNRVDKVRLKYTPLPQVLKDKRVILVEDTIVRSTTLMTLLGHMRERGQVKEIHVRVACPPIIAPCYYGIDMSTIVELYAPKHMAAKIPTDAEQAKMAKDLGADSLRYLPIQDIAASIQIPEEELCRGCLTGEYPTPVGSKLYEISLAKLKNPELYAQKGEPKRAYEEVFDPAIAR